jgi:hypothetical protein
MGKAKQRNTHTLTKKILPASSLFTTALILRHSIRLDDLELPLDLQLVSRLVLLFYSLVVLDRFNEFRFDSGDLGGRSSGEEERANGDG